MTCAAPDQSDLKAEVRALACRVSLLTGAPVLIGLPALCLLYRVAARVGAL